MNLTTYYDWNNGQHFSVCFECVLSQFCNGLPNHNIVGSEVMYAKSMTG